MRDKKGFSAVRILPLLALLAGTNLSLQAQIPVLTPPVPVTTLNVPATVVLKPYRDPWSLKVERMWDVSEDPQKQFDAFVGVAGEVRQNFSYAGANVQLTYDKAPTSPFFVARINASGLKPNFCYQLKLVGKPAKGLRGWGAEGNEAGNEAIGHKGRWWCDSSHATQTNFNDSHYQSFYKNAAPGTEHDIYSYLYTGMFVTDNAGSTNGDLYFTGEYSFHVTWRGTQGGGKHHFAGEGSIYGGPNEQPPFYGYGNSAPGYSGAAPLVKLWYEYEYLWTGDPRPNDGRSHLPNGKYNCRFLITEESFHEYSTATPNGGRWATVLGSEDYTYDAAGKVTGHDTDPANDIVFTIGSPAAPQSLTATAGNAQVTLAWNTAQAATSYQIKRSLNAGGPYTTLASNITTTNYVDSGLSNDTAYYYVVSSANAVGESFNSSEVSATPSASALPSAPANLGAAGSNAQVQLNWTSSSGAESYNVKRATNAGGPYTTVATVGTNNYTDLGLENGTPYYYVVSALNAFGESTNSNEATATPFAGQAATPIINPAGGTFFGSAAVTLNSSDGSAIYYTIDGSTPTTTSTLYSGPITLTGSATLKARSFKAGWAASNTASAAFTITKSATLLPTADAHVQAGSFAARNYGSAGMMEVKTSTSTKENRDAYLKFDLQGLGSIGTLNSVKLRVYAALSSSGTLSTTAHAVASTTWTETGLTWNNKPVRGTALRSGTVSGTAYAWYELDVTSYIQSEIAAGRRTISLVLHNGANSSPLIKVNSKEASANKPQLVVSG